VDKRCKECKSSQAKTRYWKNVKKSRAIAMKSYRKHRSKRMQYNKKYEKKVKDDVFNNYGGYVCSCCGETEKVFLTIDHINGGGTRDRKKYGRGGKFLYRWLRKNGYPEGFRVLCFNCNAGRYINGGICPHEEKKINKTKDNKKT
jgi:hypothetical protein